MPAALADLDLSRAAILMRGPTADVDRAFAALGRTPRHLPATDTSDDDSPFDADVLEAQRRRMDLDAPAAPSRGTAALLPGYAFGSLRGQTVSGPVLSGLVGLHIERHVTANLMLSIGDLSSDSGAEVTPVVGALTLHVDVGRVWGGGLHGYRLENAIHRDIIGSRWYDSFEAGLEAGVVALRSGRHQLTAFARYENASGSETGVSPFTFGVGYRFY
jgi:hypothetical protein